MTKQKLAKRILMLILPWPLSRLMPSGVRNVFTMAPGSGATPYIGTGAPAPGVGAGATAETIFVPSPIAPQGILSDVVSWPSNPTQGPVTPAFSTPSPPADASTTNILLSDYWSDSVNESSLTFDDEAGTIQADADFNLYPTNIIGDESQLQAITVDFEDSETIGTINIVQQNVDEADPVDICVDSGLTIMNWETTPAKRYIGQSFFTVDVKSRFSSIQFCLSQITGDITVNQYRAEIFTVEDDGGTDTLRTLIKSSNTIAGNNDWSATWQTFTFSPSVTLLPGVDYAIVFHSITKIAGRNSGFSYVASHSINGRLEKFYTDKTERSNYPTFDAAIKISMIPLSDETIIESFSDVVSGQKLWFPITSLKNMYIQFKDPSNPEAGLTVTGFTANTYGFSTG